MSLKLPLAPGAYDKGDQAQMRGAVERADQQNRKRQEDVVLGPGQRLVFYDEHGAEQHFTGAILGGLVRSDIAAQGLSPTEQTNARANIAAGSGAGTPRYWPWRWSARSATAPAPRCPSAPARPGSPR